MAAVEAADAPILLSALAGTNAAICLCDENDRVRFANAAFRAAFFPDFDGCGEFADAICEAVASGKGIKLETMSLEAFRLRIRERRVGPSLPPFCVDTADGAWWRVEDFRTQERWILVVATEISAVKSEEQRLRDAHAEALRASQTDFLTGVANRRWGMEQAQFALEACVAKRTPFTLALLDIDHFKSINDNHGHDAGDEVLVHFANALTQRLGLHDRVSRIGGEEFMVAMRDTPLEMALHRLDRLMRTLPPIRFQLSGDPLEFTFSAGAATASANESLKSLLARADAALYQAKMRGRRRIEASMNRATDAA